MNIEQLMNDDKNYIAPTYARFNLAIKTGNGALLLDYNNRTYVDCASGIGTNVFGVNDEEWKTAVLTQINNIQHVCNLYYSEPQVKLAKLLCQRTGAKKVFFGNSGAEANECAIKVARKYSYMKYGEGRYEIITLKNSFHGRTLATLSATGQDAFHNYFNPFLDGFKYAEANMLSIAENYTQRTCAVMIELIQGESGVNVLDKQFVLELQEFCKVRDIILIIDEVQTGNGRTGYLYAYQAYGLEPDVVTTAKGLGGGLPIGACMLFSKVENSFTYGDHGSTFGGNPVACAGAVSILNRIDNNLLYEVQGKGAYLRAHIERIPNVIEVSGMGLMIGIKINKNAKEVVNECLNKGLIVLTAHDKVRLLPPINITKEQLDFTLRVLSEVIGQ